MKKNVFNIAVLTVMGIMIFNSHLISSVIYVDKESPAAFSDQNGSDWDHAFSYLQDALYIAQVWDEIWVAEGTYYPDESYYNNSIVVGDRSASFQMINNVDIYGGFDPSNNIILWDDRNWEIYVTILSGEIGTSSQDDNSCHIVLNNNISSNTILDGFTISDANANIGSDEGGGIFNDNSSPQIINCIFDSNHSNNKGGAICNRNVSSPNFQSCKFLNNNSGHGGAVYCEGFAPVSFIDCLFWGNNAALGGAIGSDYYSEAFVLNCEFVNNTAITRTGGAIFNGYGSVLNLENCQFTNNIAYSGGGAVGFAHSYYSTQINSEIKNCTFDGNYSNTYGGAVITISNDHKVTIMHCKFMGNSADCGGALYCSWEAEVNNCLFFENVATNKGGAIYERIYSNQQDEYLDVINCTFYDNISTYGDFYAGEIEGYNLEFRVRINNCIIWDGGNDNEIWTEDGSIIDISYSDIRDGYTGTGNNIDIDPRFVDAANYDFHLKSKGGHWNPNDPSGWTIDTEHSDCIDAGYPGSAYTNEPDPNGNRINMGAYGNTIEASKSYFPIKYVDKDAVSGYQNGISWENAFLYFQDALEAVQPGDEIWIAEGTYYPDEGNSIDPNLVDNPEANFEMFNEVAIYGGFDPTYYITEFEERDYKLYETILSGDIQQSQGNINDDSYHVIYNSESASLDGTAILDGFTIQYGNARGSWPNNSGGGILNWSSEPKILNCKIRLNHAINGGGIYNNTCDPFISHCTFSENVSDIGGGIYNSNASSPIINCLFWGNGDAANGNGGGIANSSSSPILTNCTFSDNLAINGGALYNINGSSPIVTNCILWNDDALNEIYDNNSNPTVTYSDIDGGYTGYANIDEDPLFVDPQNHDYHIQLASEVVVQAGTNAAQYLPDRDIDGDPRIISSTVDMGFDEIICVVYVDWESPAPPPIGQNGENWDHAFHYLQDALEIAGPGYQIWVAEGTYYPDDELSDNPKDQGRDSHFELQNDVAIFGGFDPTNGITEFEDRNFELYETILSGDIYQTQLDPTDNCYHVIDNLNVTGLNKTAILDGFTVCYGYTDKGTFYAHDKCGGGMFNSYSSPLIRNCVFLDNYVQHGGGGIYNYNSSPEIRNSSFIDNYGWINSGAICNHTSLTYESSPLIIDCKFNNNISRQQNGGAIMNTGNSFAKIVRCSFNSNFATGGFGGAISTICSNEIINCSFINNSAINGGGISSHGYSADPLIINCIFSSNSALSFGGGICNWSLGMSMDAINMSNIINCSFSNNTAIVGNGIYNKFSNPVIKNCILWGSNEQIENDPNSYPLVSYCDVQGGYIGEEGNINVDPRFYDAPNHDLHLMSENGRWDPIAGDWAFDFGECSPCINTGDPDMICNEPDDSDVVNMGAYGNTDQASWECEGKKLLEFTNDEESINESNFNFECIVSPNPFNQTLYIELNLLEDCFIKISVINITGKTVKTITETNHNAGRIYFTWNGKNDYEHDLPNGIYLITVVTNDDFISQKVILKR